MVKEKIFNQIIWYVVFILYLILFLGVVAFSGYILYGITH